MVEFLELFQSSKFYIFVRKPCAMFINRSSGAVVIKSDCHLNNIDDAVCLGVVEGILGKFQYTSSGCYQLLLLQKSESVCVFHDGIEVRRVSLVSVLPISSSLPQSFQIKRCPRHSKGVFLTQEEVALQRPPKLVQAVQNTIKAASNFMNFKQKSKEKKRYEMRIKEELESLFESDADRFYYSPRGGDLTLWTQRRRNSCHVNDISCQADLDVASHVHWKPVWLRYDPSFVWNQLILSDLIACAMDFLQTVGGTPELFHSEESMLVAKKSLKESRHLTECLRALEAMLIPVVNGFVKQQILTLPTWDVHGRICSSEQDQVKLTIISRRSRYMAGRRYRRRGINSKGYVANYVETEQVLEVTGESSVHVFAFLQIRGSVPVFWTQSGIKYRPPIQLNKTIGENRDAFRLHLDRQLGKFNRVVAVNLAGSAPRLQESKITEAFIQQILLYNSPRITYVGFDFHEYCRGLRFANVSVLLEGVKNIIRIMQYCWLHKNDFMCTQESVFRVNCIDCLDRTNLVQSVFATVVLETQLRKLGRLPPDVELPAEFSRGLQALWADNGDALSRHYTGTAAMMGDYTRTGFRTVNGLMKDGVSSMTRYYQRFREIKRQAAIDFLLGDACSPELRFLQNCSTHDITDKELSTTEVSSLLKTIRSSCIQENEYSVFEFVAACRNIQQKRSRDVCTIGMLTDTYLHLIRIVDDPISDKEVHIRIPTCRISRIIFGSESALFRQPYPILRIYVAASTVDNQLSSKKLNESDISNKGTSTTSSRDVMNVVGTAALQRSLQNSTGHWRLDLRQPPFRLFNNYFVPISDLEEASDALKAIAESLSLLLQSTGFDIKMEILSSLLDTRGPGISMMQRAFIPSSPPEDCMQILSSRVCEALQQAQDRLRPLLLSRFPTNLRLYRFSSGLAETALNGNVSVQQKTPSNLLAPEEKPNDPSSNISANISSAKPVNGSRLPLRLKESFSRLKASRLNPGTAAHHLPSSIASGAQSVKQQRILHSAENKEDVVIFEKSLAYADSEDAPERVISPPNSSSISDFVYELEHVTEDDELDEIEEAGMEMTFDSRGRLYRVYSLPTDLKQIGCHNFLGEGSPYVAVCSSASDPLLHPVEKVLHCTVHPSSDSMSRPDRRAANWRRYAFRPTSSAEDQHWPPSYSCGALEKHENHSTPLRRTASEIQMYHRPSILEPKGISHRISKIGAPENLQGQIRRHFAAFQVPPIIKLDQAANPRLFSRLRQHQEANVSAIERQLLLCCTPETVIETQFIVF